MQNEEEFCTIIENLNTNGFHCLLAEADTTHCGETISAAVVLRVLHYRFLMKRTMIVNWLTGTLFKSNLNCLKTKYQENWYAQKLYSLGRD